jgi:hypothetical protein
MLQAAVLRRVASSATHHLQRSIPATHVSFIMRQLQQPVTYALGLVNMSTLISLKHDREDRLKSTHACMDQPYTHDRLCCAPEPIALPEPATQPTCTDFAAGEQHVGTCCPCTARPCHIQEQQLLIFTRLTG